MRVFVSALVSRIFKYTLFLYFIVPPIVRDHVNFYVRKILFKKIFHSCLTCLIVEIVPMSLLLHATTCNCFNIRPTATICTIMTIVHIRPYHNLLLGI